MSVSYKKMTRQGSISIPVAMRRNLGIEERDPIVVEEKEGKIIISPYRPRCMFCGSTEHVLQFNGKGICVKCGEKVIEKFGGK